MSSIKIAKTIIMIRPAFRRRREAKRAKAKTAQMMIIMRKVVVLTEKVALVRLGRTAEALVQRTRTKNGVTPKILPIGAVK